MAQGILGSSGIVQNAVDTMADSALTSMTANPSITAAMTATPASANATASQAGVAAGQGITQNNNIYNQVDLDAVTRDLAWQVRR